MMKRRKHTSVDAKQGSNLDPLVWQELPQDLLRRVITKLPFSRVVAFRTVCKHWHRNIIPWAAPGVQASSRATLLYFGSQNAIQSGSPWFVQVGNSKSEGLGQVQKFDPKSLPTLSNKEEFQLMICEHGLLFFGLVNLLSNAVRGFFVCNPLTSLSRSLGLPCPVKPPCGQGWKNTEVLSGTVFDSRKRSYRLVVAGVNGTGEFVTHLYDSSSSAWTSWSSLLPAIPKVREGLLNLGSSCSRGVYSDGNLYWNESRIVDSGVRNFVLKFDIQLGLWRLIPEPGIECYDDLSGAQMVLYEGKIMLWHLHGFGPFEDGRAENWPCRTHRRIDLAPGIKYMRPDMIDKIDRLLGVNNSEQVHPGSDRFRYFAFGRQNLIYHVMELLSPLILDTCEEFMLQQFMQRLNNGDGDVTLDDWVKIVVQDSNENLFTELATVLIPRFPASHFCPSFLWSFTPSLTFLP